MKKTKIAISIDQPLLDLVDSKVDGSVIRSRSQAIEFFLRKGIGEQSIKDAVMLVHKNDLKLLTKPFNDSTLMKTHLRFLRENGIENLYLVTEQNNLLNEINKETSDSGIKIINVYEKKPRGTAAALSLVKDYIKSSFVVLNGDTFNNFNLGKMFNKHNQTEKIATMGLITTSKPSKYSSVTLEGDTIIFIKDKQKAGYVINAGIYVFRHEIFTYLKDKGSLETDVLPELAQLNELQGYFTYGEYAHLSN